MLSRDPAPAIARSFILSVTLVLGACALATGCEKSEGQKGAGGPGGPGGMPPAKVTLATVQPKQIPESSELLAEINSRRSVMLFSQVPGYVRAIFVKPGDKVKEGAPILQVDPSGLQAQVQNLIANRDARKAAVANAQDVSERAAKLAPAGVISQQEFQQAQNALNASRAELNAAEAAIQAQQVQLGYTRVKAPFEGVVGDIPVKLGDLISPATPITALNQASAMEAYVSVPVTLAQKIGPETVVEILDPKGQPMIRSKVDFVSPDVRPDTQAVVIRSVFPHGDTLRYAQYVRARVTYGVHSGLVAPIAAVVRRSGQSFVFVAEHDGQRLVAKQRPVKLGDVVGNDVEVLEGLKAGEQLIVSGVQKVSNGAPLAPEAG